MFRVTTYGDLPRDLSGRRRARRVAVVSVIVSTVAALPSGCGRTDANRADHAVAAGSSTPSSTVVKSATPARPKHRVRRHRPASTASAGPPALRACDSNITVRSATTTCGFAQNVFYAFYTDGKSFVTQNAVHAYSAASTQDYAVACATDDVENVTCVAGDGGEVHFNLTAIRAYDDDQAARYAGSHDLGPDRGMDPSNVEGSSGSGADGTEDQPSNPTPTDIGPTPATEIPNYDEGNGYPVQCADGLWSQSGGIQGACSGHGGEG